MTDNTIEFRTTHNEAPKWVMKITADRRIEVNEAVEVTEAAKKVLEAMQYLLAQQRTWVGLTELEKAEITSLKWWDWEDTFDIDGFIKAIEAKLRSKNI